MHQKAVEMSNDEIDDHIYNAIVDAILNRQLAPGARLVEAPLCEAFGVTRGMLRRVLSNLPMIRLLKFSPIVGHSSQNIVLMKQKRSLKRAACLKLPL